MTFMNPFKARWRCARSRGVCVGCRCWPCLQRAARRRKLTSPRRPGLQHARSQFVEAKAKKVFYTKRWDLSDLPATAKAGSERTIRMWGSNYIVDGNVGRYWRGLPGNFIPASNLTSTR